MMMTQAILHLSLGNPIAPLPWPIDFNGRGIVLLRAQSMAEAASYYKAYSLLMVLADLPSDAAPHLASIQHLTELPGAPPLFVLHAACLSADIRQQLAAMGVADLFSREGPGEFLDWHVNMLLKHASLSQFEKTRMDVMELARQTRESLHDLSQPLSAIQGRLQLIASKIPADDPGAAQSQELVRLILDVSRHIIELQQLHRKYS